MPEFPTSVELGMVVGPVAPFIVVPLPPQYIVIVAPPKFEVLVKPIAGPWLEFGQLQELLPFEV